MNINDLVTRYSHGHDIVFQIISKNNDVYILKGVDYRLYADAKSEDLRLYENDVKLVLPKLQISPNKTAGKVLHIDGDRTYVVKAKEVYETYNVQANCIFLEEKDVPKMINSLLSSDKYDILVITGHDFLKIDNKPYKDDLTSYENSINFVSAVQQARRLYPDLDSLVIIAGACQSNYEALIKYGANFASSPTRENIHLLDPIIVASIIATTSIKEYVSPKDVISKTISGAMGGIETKGKARVHYAGESIYEHIH